MPSFPSFSHLGRFSFVYSSFLDSISPTTCLINLKWSLFPLMAAPLISFPTFTSLSLPVTSNNFPSAVSRQLLSSSINWICLLDSLRIQPPGMRCTFLTKEGSAGALGLTVSITLNLLSLPISRYLSSQSAASSSKRLLNETRQYFPLARCCTTRTSFSTMPLLQLVILKQKVSYRTYQNATTQFLLLSYLALAGQGGGVIVVLTSYFFVGAFFEHTAGSSLRIPWPNRMKSLQRMSSRVGLSAGFLTNNFCISDNASLGTLSVFGRMQLQSLMRWQVVLASSVSKGGIPKQKVYSITPILQISTQKWYPLPSNTSGAMQLGVPQTVLLHSRLNSNLVASPKSPIFTLNLLSMKIFPNFKSLWMIFCEWMYFTPLTIPSMKDWISGVMKLLRTRISQFSD